MAQPQNESSAQKSDDGFVSGADFFSSATGPVNLSADSVVDEQTGTVTIKPEPMAAAPVEQLPPTEGDFYKAKNFIEFRDMLQSYGLAWAAGDLKLQSKLEFTPDEKRRLIEAYAPLMRNFPGIPPALNIIALEAMINAPKFADVFNYRKEKNRADHWERVAMRQQAENQALQVNLSAQAAGERLRRRDAWKLWQVDTTGYFTHTERNKYLKVNDRRQRPIPSLDWDMLTKHNKPEVLQQAFPTEYARFNSL